MLAQWYNDDYITRLFDKTGTMICDIQAPRPEDSDYEMRKLRIKRREKWRKWSWGAEAKVRFI
jgi:hypothetical protein